MGGVLILSPQTLKFSPAALFYLQKLHLYLRNLKKIAPAAGYNVIRITRIDTISGFYAAGAKDRGRGGTTRGRGRREVRTGAVRGVNEVRVNGGQRE